MVKLIKNMLGMNKKQTVEVWFKCCWKCSARQLLPKGSDRPELYHLCDTCRMEGGWSTE